MLNSRIQMRFCFFVVWTDERRTKEDGQQKKLKRLAKKISFFYFFRHIKSVRQKIFKYAIWTKTRTSKNPGNGAGNTLTTISSYFIRTIPDCVWEKRKRFDCIVKQEKSKKNERER